MRRVSPCFSRERILILPQGKRTKMQTGSLTRSLALPAIVLSTGVLLPHAEILTHTSQNIAALLPGAAVYRRALRLGLWFCKGVIVLASALCIGIGGIALVEVVMAMGRAGS